MNRSIMLAMAATGVLGGLLAAWPAETGKAENAPAAALVSSTNPMADRVVLIARDERQLRFALAAAEKTPNTVVSLVKDTVYKVSSPVRVRGRGTLLAGNGAIIEQHFSYSGKPDPITGEGMPGIAVLIIPRLGAMEPWSKEKDKDYIWLNPKGTVLEYAKAAGGDPTMYFGEYAPTQYPGPLLAKYTLAQRVLVPAEHVTVENLVIRSADAGADVAMMVRFAANVTLRNMRGEGEKWKAGAVLDVVSSERVLVEGCGFPAVNLNSATYCRVTGCKDGSVSMEEMVRWCDVDHNELTCVRTNDITCEGNRFLNNRIVGQRPNFGSMALAGSKRTTVVGNVCDDHIWFGGDTVEMVLEHNSAPRLMNYKGRGPVSQKGNSWQPEAATTSAPAGGQ